MTGTGANRNSRRTGVSYVLIALALLVRVLVPPGFMTVPSADGRDGGIIICTGDGPLDFAGTAFDDTPGETPQKGQTASGHCVFSGCLWADASCARSLTPVVFALEADTDVPHPPGIIPGRGLAAPPMPARGPPDRLA